MDEDKAKFSDRSAVKRHTQHVNPAFVTLIDSLGYGRVFSRALGDVIWDDQGKSYIDGLAGFGTINVGHNHPRLIARLEKTLHDYPLHFCHTGIVENQGLLAEKLSKISGLDYALFSNSGAEAVDAALKVARVATKRRAFIYCENAYHGTTLSTLPLMGQDRIRSYFEPLRDDYFRIPFNDLEALENALHQTPCAAFIVEPIQAEGGVIVPSDNFLSRAKALCQKKGALLMVDEIQTGMGRTGRWLAYQHENVLPDIVTMAKALGGGMAPIAATLVSKEIYLRAYGKPDRFDLHSSTFAGGALAVSAALETLSIIEDEKLFDNAKTRGDELLALLKQNLSGHPLVKSIRGKGLLIGILLGATDTGLLNQLVPNIVDKIAKQGLAQWIAVLLQEKGLIVQPSALSWNVLRLEPPLTLSKERAADIAKIVTDTLNECVSIPKLCSDVAYRLVGRKMGFNSC